MTADRSFLVTGGAAGIGAEIARLAGAAGYRVGVLDTDGAGAQRTAGEIGGAVALQGSVADEAEVEAALDSFGTPEVLVNNAGIVRFGPLLEHSAADFGAVVAVNLLGTFLCGRAAARRMAAAGGGRIVNIASMNGTAPGPNAGAYASTKAGIIMLTQQMALEWSRLGIRVNCVAPGLIDGGMSAPINADPVLRAERELAVPAGRLGSAADIAKAVLWLASGDADYITGQTLLVDGGITMSILSHLPRPASVDGVGGAARTPGRSAAP
ncbi:MAG: SDR family NAD(P)-dependent oxidoreductase [bacterium]|nr:SDR family NAD(P)-dependent oxidoreductase [bacterium]MCY3924518.1 SDR family NAD(P)-dependent oxidoreductase [bacterium]